MDKIHHKTVALLGSRIRSLRIMKGWTQQELGEEANVNYKFLGEIERGQKNPSFLVLLKIAASLNVEPVEMFRFDAEILDRNTMEAKVIAIVKTVSDHELHRVLMLLQALNPIPPDPN